MPEKKEYLSEIVEPLLVWYHKNARVLPWREQPLPYYVWISEIMLQQTRVEAVKPYFDRFITALPTVRALALAEEAVLLKLWEGLGYYNRVRNLQKAAKVILEQYGGELPGDYEQLLALPGIGPYTAGAISSIAFGIPMPAVDGNVLRVISRVLASREDIGKEAVKKEIAGRLSTVLPHGRVGAFNQALMELGATVCLPNGTPQCLVCPLRETCLARREGIETELPVKQKKKPRKIEARTVFLLISDGRAALRRRGDAGLLAGLWELPNLLGDLSEAEAKRAVREWDLSPVKIEKLPAAKHIFSHVEWHMTGYQITVKNSENTELCWANPKELERDYALPSAFSAYRSILMESL